jgi:capsular exopolysaccharide synthesis family protein
MFTSAHPGDGKTITTLNVAIALAQRGHTAVVVDADLRKGKCHALLRLENRRGLSNILVGKFTLEEGLQRTAIPGLSLLSRGESHPHPVALFGSPKMAEVVETLRQRFDFVLVDSPPAIVVSDAVALSQYCDGVVLVLRAQTTSVETAQRLVARMEAVRATILGVVLNGVDIRDPDYADYHYYYSSYYAAVQKEGDDQH